MPRARLPFHLVYGEHGSCGCVSDGDEVRGCALSHYSLQLDVDGQRPEAYALSRGHFGTSKAFENLGLARIGVRTSRKRTARIVRAHRARENDWIGTTRGCVRRPKGEKKPAVRRRTPPDMVRCDFSADDPNRAWFADIAYVRTHHGCLYLAVVPGIWSRRIVGRSMSDRMTAEFSDDVLKVAIARRRPSEGCIHHSDHGSQYALLLLGRTMRDAGYRARGTTRLWSRS